MPECVVECASESAGVSVSASAAEICISECLEGGWNRRASSVGGQVLYMRAREYVPVAYQNSMLRQCSVGGPDGLCSTGQIDAWLRMTTRYITHARSQILRYRNLHISGGIVRGRTLQWRGVAWSACGMTK